MHKRFLIPGLIILLFPIVWFGADAGWKRGSDEAVWVARVATSSITLDDYRDAYADYLLSTGLPDMPKRRGDFLERLISMRLLALQAEETGLDDSQEFRQSWERVRQKLLIEGFVKTRVLAPIDVTEAELKDMFVRVNTRLEASHLYAGTLAEAEALKRRLDEGASFEELAQEVFASEALQQSGGSVGEFGFDEMDRAFEDAAYAMEPGQISGPVRTAQGYSIIRLDNRFTSPMLTESEFARRLDGLRRYVLVRKHDAAREQLRLDIVADLSPRFDDSVVEALLAELSGASDLSEEQTALPTDVLVRFKGGSMDVASFMEAAANTSDEQRAAVVDRTSLESFVRGLLVRHELLERAEAAGIEDTDAYEVAAGRERFDLLYETAWNDMLTGIVVSDDSVQAHMDRFPDEFEVSEQAHVREILVASSSEAARIRREVNADNFRDLAVKHSIREGAGQHGGDLGFVTREQLGILAETAFDAGTGSIIGPLAVGGRFAILQILEKSPRRPATLAEARVRVEDQLRAAWIRKAVRDRVAELRQTTAVETRSELLSTIDLRANDSPSVSPLNP